ncbi:MAG: hypothetical protein ACI8UO_004629 [Verrucomicrobiales bacterium]|jgi:hypothetical protein
MAKKSAAGPERKSAEAVSESGGNSPVAVVECGNIKVPIWENSNAEGATWHSIKTPYKEYKVENNGQEEWKQTPHLNRDDIPKAIEALQRAYSMICVTRIVRFGEEQTSITKMAVSGQTKQVIERNSES